MNNKVTPLRAIHAHCKECKLRCGRVSACDKIDCKLHTYRNGKNIYGTKSDAVREARVLRAQSMRAAKIEKLQVENN